MIDHARVYDEFLYDCYVANRHLTDEDWELYGREEHHVEVPARDQGVLTPLNSQHLTTYQHWVAGVLQSEILQKCCFAFIPKGVLPLFLESLRVKWSAENMLTVMERMTPEQRSERSRKRNASMTPEQRSESARKGKASMTPEERSDAIRKGRAKMNPKQRSDIAVKINAGRTPEQRSESARKRSATMTPAQRSESARKGKASMTPEQRSEALRKGKASMTPEERSGAILKGHETRRRKAALRSLGRDQFDAIWSDGFPYLE